MSVESLRSQFAKVRKCAAEKRSLSWKKLLNRNHEVAEDCDMDQFAVESSCISNLQTLSLCIWC